MWGLMSYNRSLFKNMSYHAGSVWVIDVDKEDVHIMLDRIKPEWSDKHFSLDTIRQFTAEYTHEDFIATALRHISPEFLTSMRGSFSLYTKIYVGDSYHTLTIVMTPSLDDTGVAKLIYVTMQDITAIDARRTGRLYAEASDILKGANMGLWNIILDEGEPKFIVDEKTAELVGINEQVSEEEAYKFWYERVDKRYLPMVEATVKIMCTGKPSEVTYPYYHPTRGMITVRCGGNRKKDYSGNGIMIQGYHQDFTEYNRRLLEKEEINKSIARVYLSMYVLDIEKDTYEELGSSDQVHDFLLRHPHLGCQEALRSVLTFRTTEPFHESVRDFADFSTLDERMRNKNYIQFEAVNADDKWLLFEFIRMGSIDEPLKRILFVVMDIDDTKRREETLMLRSNTDELTGLLNRHAYEDEISSLDVADLGNEFWMISIDVNGLKAVNDAKGHKAGDEILCGTADCLKLAFCNVGKVYRMGGDEFTVTINKAKRHNVLEALGNLEKYKSKWHGEYVDSISFSMGIVNASEIDDCSVHKLEIVADERMYKEKKKYHNLNKTMG